ncbi:MAG: 5'-nucleotidase C-terminal domain-containing protein [Bacteroidia bacterium]
MRYSIYIILFSLVGCITKLPLQVQPSNNLNISAEQVGNEKIDKIIEPYTMNMAESMNEVIGFCPQFLEKKRPHSILGSFMAEAVHNAASKKVDFSIDFCLLNYGGIRSTLDSGDITIGEVYQLMPFENEIVILRLNSLQLDSLYTIIELKGGEPFVSHQWEGKTAYHVMNQNVFYIATNDYIANGGDNYTILTQAEERIETGIKIRDGLISYIKEHNPIPMDYQPSKH